MEAAIRNKAVEVWPTCIILSNTIFVSCAALDDPNISNITNNPLLSDM